MKNIIIIFFCTFFYINTSSQIIKALLDSENKTFGYSDFKFINSKGGSERFTVGFPKPLNAKEFQVEIQDINLQKINDVLLSFDEPVSRFITSYNKKSVLILGVPAFSQGSLNNLAYYIYDLHTNKLSPKYTFSEELDRTASVSNIEPIDGKGFIFSIAPIKKRNKIDLFAIDDQNKKMWLSTFTNSINGKKKDIIFYHSGSTGNVYGLTFSDNWEDEQKQYGLLLVNKDNGKEISRQLIDTPENRYEPKNITFKEGKIFMFGDLFPAKAKFDGRKAGMFMIKADLEGNILTRKSQTWENMRPIIDLDENGLVKNKGYFYSHDFIFDNTTNHIIMPSEFFMKNGLLISIGHLFFLEFDENFNLLKTNTVIKNLRPYREGTSLTNNIHSWGYSIKNSGEFDYIFANELDRGKGTVFYYASIDKEAEIFRKGEYTYGTVSYIDGKFSNDKINFTSKNLMRILPNKPGYILLFEESEKGFEKRIEKINY